LTYDKLLLRCPLVGNIIKKYNISNIFRTIGILLNSNIPLDQTLIIVSETIDNLYYKQSFKDISIGVNKGKNISNIICLYPSLFPDTLCHMIAVGEKSGDLPETFIYLSEYYENEFDDLTKNLSNSIEPILMIVMGIAIGFVAISFITPIYEITNNLKK
jgi:type II secretory pathway component PulF